VFKGNEEFEVSDLLPRRRESALLKSANVTEELVNNGEGGEG